MLYFVSLADNHTGAFVGAVYVNAADYDAAQETAVEIAAKSSTATCFSVLSGPVPAGGPAIPAIGRLLSKEDMTNAGLEPVAFNVDD